jgi:hypothetical protein
LVIAGVIAGIAEVALLASWWPYALQNLNADLEGFL